MRSSPVYRFTAPFPVRTPTPRQVGSPVLPARCPARGPGEPPTRVPPRAGAPRRGAELSSRTQRPRAGPRRNPGARESPAPPRRPAHPPRTYPAVRRPGARARSPARWRFLLPGGAAGRRRFLPDASRRLLPRSAGRRAARGDGGVGRTRSDGGAARLPALAPHAGCKVQEERPPSSCAQLTGCARAATRATSAHSEPGRPSGPARWQRAGGCGLLQAGRCRGQISIRTLWRAHCASFSDSGSFLHFPHVSRFFFFF